MREQSTIEIDVRNLSDQICDCIKEMILLGEIKQGERIPEEMVSKRFNVSRTPVREALRGLEKQGLVYIYPRRYVAVITLGPEDKRHIGQIRYMMDSLSIRQMIKSPAKQEGIDRMEKLLEQCHTYIEKENRKEIFAADREFHLTLTLYSGNPLLYEYHKNFIAMKVQLLVAAAFKGKDLIDAGMQFHVPLLDAIKHGRVEEAQELNRLEKLDFYGEDLDI